MKNRLVKDSALILMANCFVYLATMVNTRLISSSFSLVDYGYRAQVLSIVAILVYVFSLGMSAAPNYFIPLAKEETKESAIRIVRNLYVAALAVCAGMALVVMVFFQGIVDYYGNDLLFGFEAIIVLMVAEQIFYSFYSGIQVSQHRSVRATVVNFLRALCTMVVTAAVCAAHGSIFAVILSTLVVDCVFCLFTMADSSAPALRLGKWWDAELVKEIAKYCIPLGLSTITAGLCTQVDKLFIARLCLPEDLAMYSNMCTELPLAAISGAFIAVISPHVVKLVSRGDSAKAIMLWGYVVELVSLVLFLVIAMLVVFAKQFVFLLYSENYLSGAYLFQVFMLVEVARITYFGLILRSYGRTRLILACSALALVLDVILNALSYFVFDAGLMGFALATMVSTFAIQLLQLGMSCKVSGTRFGRIFPWGRLGLCGGVNIALGVVFAAIVALLGLQDSTNLVLFVPLCLVWAAFYALVVFRRARRLYDMIRNVDL